MERVTNNRIEILAYETDAGDNLAIEVFGEGDERGVLDVVSARENLEFDGGVEELQPNQNRGYVNAEGFVFDSEVLTSHDGRKFRITVEPYLGGSPVPLTPRETALAVLEQTGDFMQARDAAEPADESEPTPECHLCGKPVGVEWSTDPDEHQEITCGPCIALYEALAAEGRQVSVDAHDELWPAQDVYDFLRMNRDDDDAPVAARMPIWFRLAYDNPS